MEPNKKLDLKAFQLSMSDNVSRYYGKVIALWAVALVFLGIAAILFFQSMDTYALVEIRKQDFDDAQTELSYVTTAQTVAEQNVTAYNTLLSRLVPPTEDYFSVVASMERLSLRTGIEITRYSINLPAEGSEIYPLSIVATIPVEEFDRFLETYQFGTGRLVTISAMNFTNQSSGNVRFTMNFYSKEVTTTNISRIASLSMDDLDLLDEIARQIRQSESMANGGEGIPADQSIIPPDLQM